ncbi:MAG: DUF2723 domain-containing protein, partial [Patescibacteria group bacterium]|nr:DUF2723 domain-containing protein [Patescibacteria group bacterium]
MKKLLHKNYFWFLLVFSIIMVVYLFTLCPDIYLEDSAEFVTVAATLGIAHPSGYPLYVLLGKLFTFIPFGSIAWRVNLMSAFFGALTGAFLFLIIQKIFRQRGRNKEPEKAKGPLITLLLYYLLPFSSALVFAFTQIFWSQSVVAEVYTLNTFFVVMIVWLLLVWAEKIQEYKKIKKQEKRETETQRMKNRADKILLLIIFLYSLSLTNHEMMLLLAPVFLVFVMWHDWKIIKNYKFIFAAAFLLIVGISLYLYLPIRASQNPAFNWGNPQSWES